VDATNVSVALAFIAGLLSFLSPCVLPLAPAYVGYLSGTAMVTAEGVVVGDRRATLFHATSFILGFSAVFVALGASVGLIGYLLYDFMPLIQKVGGVLLVVFGLHYMGVLKIPFLWQEKRIEFKADPRLGYFSSLLVGVFFGAGWTPCIGLTLSGILMLAGNSATVGRGAFLLAVYSAGLGIPFLLLGLALDRMSGWLKRLNRRLNLVSIVSGVFLILMGIIVYTNAIGKLNAWFYRVFGFNTLL
jgi:cytochrome c-type biogenesis protein